MSDTPIPRISPGDTNPASDLKTDIIKDVEREHEITGDVVGPRSDEMPDDEHDGDES
ncbi:hypothetical protein [Microbacterium sp. CPCC 204701]|uniref:hypothetical protein n=1 Tax=Microbacterium sp. CPCC 204701 TaxID=2493084 RepID=UPI0013E28B3F|nr:hypothetical protein [Microbacterium sp. CPCC 204701]